MIMLFLQLSLTIIGISQRDVRISQREVRISYLYGRGRNHQGNPAEGSRYPPACPDSAAMAGRVGLNMFEHYRHPKMNT